MKMKQSFGEKFFSALIVLSCLFAMGITLYPFVYVFSMSISSLENVLNGSVWLLPKGFSLDSYKLVFENPEVWTSYYNTIWYVTVGTMINVSMTILAAYPLSRPGFFLKKYILILIAFTMFFGGGLIPTFLLVNELGLYNTRWAIVIPGAVSAFLIIVARTFFQSISEGLHESARMDGASEYRILANIYLPLSKPILAVLTIFYAVAHWNSFFSALIYLPERGLQPMQLFLMRVLVQNSQDILNDPAMMDAVERMNFAAQLKYAVTIVVVTPILMIYPFLQKYFVKGVMIGSIKE